MKMINGILSMTLCSLALSVVANAAAPTVDNYREILKGINSKFDRDYGDVNNVGEPSPGALATVESFLTALNDLGINAPGTYHLFMPDNTTDLTCNAVGPNCSEMKVVVRNSEHAGDSTLFGAPQIFNWDIIVWGNNGDGTYERFLEGYYTPVAGTAGIANILLTSCSGCSTVGRSQIEWDATGAEYHLRSRMYDTRLSSGPTEVYGGVAVDARYSPTTGDMKLIIAANNVCDSGSVGDSLCSGGQNDHGAGYSALVHANTKTGNVFVKGLASANNSLNVPIIDAMCIKSDKTEDVLGTVCQADGIDDFSGMLPYAPNDAPVSFVAEGSPWPMVEITDAPLF